MTMTPQIESLFDRVDSFANIPSLSLRLIVCEESPATNVSRLGKNRLSRLNAERDWAQSQCFGLCPGCLRDATGLACFWLGHGIAAAIHNVKDGSIAIGHPFGMTGAGLFEVLQSAAAPSSGALSSSSKCRGVQAAETVATWCGPLAVAPAWWLSGTSDEAAGAARDVTKDATKDAVGGARQPAGRIPAGINEGIY
jgi:hypothetical protein